MESRMKRTRKWIPPSPSLRGSKHAYRAACTRIDNRIISREPARRLMSALMNNRATYGPVSAIN